ncbi:MAG: response regulator [Pseudomonadota bacterium]
MIDDDADVVEAIAMVLAEEGYQVVAGTSHDEAVGLALAHRPAVVLVDYRMPGVDVSNLVASLRLASPRAMLALCTAADVPETLARQVGADLALPKPFTIEELLALVRRAAAGGDRPDPVLGV